MPKRIVAVCGQAAVGKQWFIDQLRTRADLRQRFGIPESWAVFGPSASDVDKIRFAQCDVAVWKWQHFTHYFIYGFALDFPNIEQQVILVWRPPGLHLPDHQTKGQQRLDHARREQDNGKIGLFEMTVGMDERDLARQWREHFVPRFGDDSVMCLRFGIRPVIVDGSSGDYPQISWGQILSAT